LGRQRARRPQVAHQRGLVLEVPLAGLFSSHAHRYTERVYPFAPISVIAMPCRFDFAQLPLSANDRAAITEAAEILADRLPVERMVLYGSKARGDDRADSDIDLLILTSRPLSVAEGFQVTDLLQPVQHRHHCIISPLRLSADEWYQGVYQVLGIRHEIDRDGIDVPLPSKTQEPRHSEPLTR
jgi:predicted nucleotidyltransferase